jgi:NAD(P)-dependent dehydrogenase (short-subunit alcohol dehydrogenase family)
MERGKIALVTGSATGTGANIALDLAANRYFVIVTGRNESNLQKVVALCNRIASCNSGASCRSTSHEQKTGSASSAIYFKADLENYQQLDQLIGFVLPNFKRLDVLVNNACWRGKYKHLLECDEAYADFKQAMRLNVAVPLYLVERCVIRTKAAAESSADM